LQLSFSFTLNILSKYPFAFLVFKNNFQRYQKNRKNRALLFTGSVVAAGSIVFAAAI